MGTKGIDQRPYDRDKFNNNFDAIFGILLAPFVFPNHVFLTL